MPTLQQLLYAIIQSNLLVCIVAVDKFCMQYCNCQSLYAILSLPNNNHNPNNKTTITVVGLRLSNRWEHHPPTTRNSKPHDRAEIEQKLENKSYQSIYQETPTPKIARQGPKKSKMTPKLSRNKMAEFKVTKKIKFV